MWKKHLLALFVSFALVLGLSQEVLAQDPSLTGPTTLPPAEASEDTSVGRKTTWGPNYDSDQIKSYQEAVSGDNCATPSLECLVHQTSRFVAIEWVNSIAYPNGGFAPGEAPAPGELPTSNSQRGTTLTQGIGTLIGLMYANPAASTPVFIADVLDSARITPKAYAQGLGFASLNPILGLWKVFRNIAYMFFVVVILIIGFMIMFRQKIGGQTAVTAQQAIPNVVVSLILVTFSFAIAGFMIDLMYLSMYLIVGIFAPTLPSSLGNPIDLSIIGLFSQLAGAANVFKPFENINLVGNLFDSVVSSELAQTGLGIVGGLTLTVVLAIAILIGTVRLFFELLKSYASVVMSVVTSPVVLMFGAFPGSNQFGPWLKDLIGNLIPFPLILLVLVMFYQFQAIPAGSSGGFLPPFLLGRGQAGAITSLLGLAIILALPEIVKDAKRRLVKEGYGMIIAKGAMDSLKTGWNGGEIIPGWAATNTNRIPVLGSGKDALRKMTIGATGTAGAVSGAVSGARLGYLQKKAGVAEAGVLRGTIEGIRSRGGRWARSTGDKLGDSNIKTKPEEKKAKH